MRYISVGNKNHRAAVNLLAEKRPLHVQSQKQNSDPIPEKSHTELTYGLGATLIEIVQPIEIIGAGDGIRTHDIQLGKKSYRKYLIDK